MPPSMHWVDRVTAPLAPQWTLRRQRARLAADQLRHYEAATPGRRTDHWNRVGTDANLASGPALSFLRNTARDLVRNNPYAENALSTIVDHVVGGWGISARPATRNDRAAELWKLWAGTTACDADGRHDMAGLQRLVMRTTAESGEALVRRRFRRLEDGLPIPLQLQVLEPDFLDTFKDGTLSGGGRIVQGVEFDSLGRRAAYWMFREHPGGTMPSAISSRVPAADVLHIYRGGRPGQVRDVPWFTPSLLRFKDHDELEDSVLMKQRVAACLAVIMTDPDGSNLPAGTVKPDQPNVDMLAPGLMMNAPVGRDVQVVNPPTTADYPAYSTNVQRGIAAGLGLTYEDFSGDYANMPFSAARMSRLRHWARVDGWRWRMLIPQFCDPAWQWAMSTAIIAGLLQDVPAARWTPQPMPMIEPDKEGLAIKRNVRAGVLTLSEAIRERGYDPVEFLEDVAAFNALLDKHGIIFDSDPRNRTEQGQALGAAAALEPAPAKEGDEDA
jgi:lambda family phage portal protein